MFSDRGRAHARPPVLQRLLLGLGVWVLASCGTERGPIASTNEAAVAATEVLTPAGYPLVTNPGPPELISLDSVSPQADVDVIFFQGRSTQRHAENGVLVADGAGGLLRIDSRLRARRLQVRIDGRVVSSAASAPDGGVWIVTGDGEVLLVNRAGDLVSYQSGPWAYSLVSSTSDGTAWLVRSPEQFTFQPAWATAPALLAQLDAEGEAASTLGNGVVPAHHMLSYMASAGHLVMTDSVAYFAPFIRDEILALNFQGDTLWVSQRGLPQAVDEPRFEVLNGSATIDYAPVNLGLAMGPDGLLYVLSIPGFTTSATRIDAVDPSNGHVLRTVTTNDVLPTLAVDVSSRVYHVDAFDILTGVPLRERVPFREFDLELLTGGSMSSADLTGRVTLINFWASWCGPCREEMPALDRLSKGIEDQAFQFITMNEDINPLHASTFIREYGFEFPVLLGRGDLRAKFHYTGLPWTVLIDRQGRLVSRWIGFAGEEQVQNIRAVIVAELGYGVIDTASTDVTHEGHSGH